MFCIVRSNFLQVIAATHTSNHSYILPSIFFTVRVFRLVDIPQPFSTLISTGFIYFQSLLIKQSVKFGYSIQFRPSRKKFRIGYHTVLTFISQIIELSWVIQIFADSQHSTQSISTQPLIRLSWMELNLMCLNIEEQENMANAFEQKTKEKSHVLLTSKTYPTSALR